MTHVISRLNNDWQSDIFIFYVSETKQHVSVLLCFPVIAFNKNLLPPTKLGYTHVGRKSRKCHFYIVVYFVLFRLNTYRYVKQH